MNERDNNAERCGIITAIDHALKGEKKYIFSIVDKMCKSGHRTVKYECASKMIAHSEYLQEYIRYDESLTFEQLAVLLDEPALTMAMSQFFSQHPEIILEPYRQFCLSKLSEEAKCS